MNITSEELYWLTRLDYFRIVFGVSIAAVGVVWLSICLVFADENNVFGILKTSLIGLLLALLCACGLVFIPTTKEMAMIKVVPAIVNSDFMQNDLPDDAKQIYELGKKAVVEYLEGGKK